MLVRNDLTVRDPDFELRQIFCSRCSLLFVLKQLKNSV